MSEASRTPALDERAYRLLADHLPALIWHGGPDRRCAYVNKAWLDFTGRSEAQELGDGWLEGVHPDDRARCLAAIAAASAARGPLALEFRLRRHDGDYRWISERGTPLIDQDGGFAGHVCCAVDVHRQFRLRQALGRSRQALRQREVLLAELRHRTKNTIQMIGSLLALLARQVSSACAPAVREMARRVRAFGLAHEALDSGRRTGEVDLGLYLRELTGGLLELVQGRSVRLEVRAEPVTLPLGRATPLGLAVNELVTNALKYGFPDDRAGAVTVEVRRREPNLLEIAVADNGVGLPENCWPPRNAASLGLLLVAGLARQAGAAVTVTREDGTCFTLVLPLQDRRASRPEPGLQPSPGLPCRSHA